GLRERGPAGARFELRLGRKEGRAAAHAAVGAFAVVVPILAGEGALGALLAGDAELLARKLALPLLFGFDGLIDHGPPEEMCFDAVRYSVGCSPDSITPASPRHAGLRFG